MITCCYKYLIKYQMPNHGQSNDSIFTMYSQILWSEEFADAVFSDQNSEGKTPLQLAVEKEHVG